MGTRVSERLGAQNLATGQTASREICDDCYIRSFCADAAEAIIQYGNELVRQDLNSGRRTTLLKASTGVICDAVVSPDNKWLAFQLSEPTGGYAIYLCPMRDRIVPEQDWQIAVEEASYQKSACGSIPTGLSSARPGWST